MAVPQAIYKIIKIRQMAVPQAMYYRMNCNLWRNKQNNNKYLFELYKCMH